MGRSTKSKLLIWQWNSRCLISNKSELHNKIQNSKIKPDILCTQETFLTADSKHIPKIKGSSVCEFLNRENGQKGRGLAIFVNDLLPNTTFTRFTQPERPKSQNQLNTNQPLLQQDHSLSQYLTSITQENSSQQQQQTTTI
ncbi:hypothetical protein ACJMK2_015373 [Sinanodonta woodiana]|uniref:Endonuclease/exonuclease/phosphatase domain-containing protein n=1 Tax=Sinanodonta woodiana TaxID=1069815 RepID=A0ABD3US68_SINWO